MKRRLNEVDVEVIFLDADTRAAATPSIFDLEEQLKLLSRKYPSDVFFARRYLRWLMKKMYKEYGLIQPNPYIKMQRR